MGTKKGKADIDMEYMKFDDAYVVRLDRGEEIVESLTKICDREKITLATIEGIGAADHAVIGLYNVGEQVYHKTELNGPMEITALTHIDTFLDCGADIENGIVVNTHTLSAGEHLAAYFQKYTFIRKLHVTASIQKNIIFRYYFTLFYASCKDKKTNSQQFNKKRTRETRFAFVSRV